MNKVIPYGGQFIDFTDIKSVSKSLKNNLISGGEVIKKFEKKLSNYLQVKHTISCSSGTAALHLSFAALGVKKNDIIIMPIINFISSYNMCSSLGAKIFFADVDSKTGQMTPQNLIDCIKKYSIKKIKAVVTMYMGGYPENIINFYKLKKKYNFKIVEDCCHALGAKYKVKNNIFSIGSCKHSDIATFSLHPLKPITTGEGGFLTTNDKKIYERANLLRSHGILKSKKFHWKYDVIKSGYNYRLSDINCALGYSQLSKIKRFIDKRKKIYYFYKKSLNGYKKVISFPNYNRNIFPSYHLVIININFKNLKQKDKFFKYLINNSIMCQFHYIPINKFSIFKNKKEKFYSSEIYYKTSLSIPIFHQISPKQLRNVVYKIKKYFN